MPLQELLTQVEHALAPVRYVMKPILSDPLVIGVWALFVVASVGTLRWDIHERNQALPSMMKGVWTLVALYSGPFGLAVYWYSGRTKISNDSLWRRGFRSTGHCYSGCGAGEALGFVLLAGLLVLQSTLLVASQAHISDLLFWGALAFSLSVGFVFAFPVNAVLVHFDVKEGMKNPAEMRQSSRLAYRTRMVPSPPPSMMNSLPVPAQFDPTPGRPTDQ
jgi:hypothetical protein